MIQSFPHINKYREPISNFYFKKKWFLKFFWVARLARLAMKTTYHSITFEPCNQNLWIFLGLKAISGKCYLKISKKKIKTPFVVSYLKLLCCQKTQFRALGVIEGEMYIRMFPTYFRNQFWKFITTSFQWINVQNHKN